MCPFPLCFSVGRYVVIEVSRNRIDCPGQSPFSIFTGQNDHEDEEIKKAQEFIESNVIEKISVESLSSRFLMRKRIFIERFKKATDYVSGLYSTCKSSQVKFGE